MVAIFLGLNVLNIYTLICNFMSNRESYGKCLKIWSLGLFGQYVYIGSDNALMPSRCEKSSEPITVTS